jgi:hypothetical protein
MKILSTAFLCCILIAGAAMAAAIDGKWVSERKMDRGGESVTIKQVLDLKANGNKLTGSVAMTFGEREMKTEIGKGKIDGAKFSFETVMTTPNGEFKTTWEGTVEGDVLKGTTKREGGQGGGQARPFEAKRQ